MKLKNRLAVGVGLLAASGFCEKSYAQFRTYSNEFLNIGSGARALGMGSSQAAIATDATAGYWNPAGLAYVKDAPNFSAMHAEYFSGIGKYDYLTGAFPIQDNSKTLGFSLIRFGVDDIPNTLYLVNADGTLNYNNISSFSSADYAGLMSYSQFIRDDDELQISFGVNAKIIYRKVGSFANAWGAGLDGGLLVKGHRWSLAAMAKDATTTYNSWKFHFTDAEKQVLYLTNNSIPVKSTESTAPSLVLAGAYNFEFSEKFHLLATSDMHFTFDGQRNTLVSNKTVSIDPHFGLEGNIADVAYVRAGVSNFQQGLADGDTLNMRKVWIFQPSLGAGFRIGKVNIDYAFTNLANQSNALYTHVFSVKLNLGEAQPENKNRYY